MQSIEVYLLTQTLLLFVLFFASIGDIKQRKLLPIVPLASVLILSVIEYTYLFKELPTIGFFVGINAGITILVVISLYALNIWRSRRDKKRLVGGGDIITYAVTSLVFPVSILGLSSIWLPLFSIVLAALAGIVPKVSKSHEKKGIPFIVYLSIAYAAGVVLQTTALYIV